MATNQELFNKAVAHLRTQGRPARLPGDADRQACAYRGINKMMCAVGCLIPDELYGPDLELEGPFSKKFDRLAEFFEFGEYPDRREFLSDLQSIHDECSTEADGSFDKANLEQFIAEFARDWELTVP
jgi:hypothetical protein